MATTPTPAAPNDLLKLENQLCFPFYAVSRQLTKAYQPYLQVLGLTYPQYLVFLLLWEHEQLTVKELGKQLLLDSGTLTPLLKRMEQKQWLSRSRDPRDERSVIIALRPAGRALESQACDIPNQILAKMNLTPPELDTLRAQLHHMLTQLT
ncbi:MarR family transcriptional regulator [Hymenobacter sp. HMF4947]|uniref:MarR family transcriptional regulator n=1 Tax=Hymenobacter ginkgonis TaxID=2682976 RepID=A0A7K1TJS0_9BACT|nr:MarR family transcriptional regulator [Hymenobacter ginkgonis]MVN78622.1 MarR family transcriptional regulator [Hymenobacter ginkgonis]